MCLQLHYNKPATTATLVWNPLNISTRITLSILNFVRSVRYLWKCSRLMSLQLITMNFNFLMTNICIVAFWHISFICFAHLQFLDIGTPKCLWLSTWFKFSELNFEFIGFMFWRNEITIYSVFLGIKVY
jgi:hypothetical protein